VLGAITGIETMYCTLGMYSLLSSEYNHNVRRLLACTAKHSNVDLHPAVLHARAVFSVIIPVLFLEFSRDNNFLRDNNVLLSADLSPSGVATARHSETDSCVFKYSGTEEKKERVDVGQRKARSIETRVATYTCA
jgi:hypothetical protein